MSAPRIRSTKRTIGSFSRFTEGRLRLIDGVRRPP
jgi:hypothetical protein